MNHTTEPMTLDQMRIQITAAVFNDHEMAPAAVIEWRDLIAWGHAIDAELAKRRELQEQIDEGKRDWDQVAALLGVDGDNVDAVIRAARQRNTVEMNHEQLLLVAELLAEAKMHHGSNVAEDLSDLLTQAATALAAYIWSEPVAWMPFTKLGFAMTHHTNPNVEGVCVSMMNRARDEGFKGTFSERLAALEWTIKSVCVHPQQHSVEVTDER